MKTPPAPRDLGARVGDRLSLLAAALGVVAVVIAAVAVLAYSMLDGTLRNAPFELVALLLVGCITVSVLAPYFAFRAGRRRARRDSPQK